MKVIRIVFIICMLVSVGLPYILTKSGAKESRLGGVTKKSKSVHLTFKNITDGSFQQNFERRFPRSLSIFGDLVKADNQLSYSVFNQISSNSRSKVILGNKGHLIERSYLTAFNGQTRTSEKRYASIAEDLKNLRDRLAQEGKALIVLISTNKPAFYPELVPEWYSVKGAAAFPRPGDKLTRVLREQGIGVFNTKEFLKQIEAETGQPMFAATGTHWNQYASCQIVSELGRQASLVLDKKVPELECRTKGIRRIPTEQDMDLLKISNLLFPKKLIQPTVLLETVIKRDADSYKPNLLIVGTSFSGELMNMMNSNPVFNQREFLYYFERQILSRSGTSKPIDRDKFDINGAIARNDIVLLEANEASPQRLGYGFIKKVLESR